jgi:hypothetical protein
MAKNVFVFGLDDFNRRKLASIRRPEEYRFHSLLDPDEIRGAREYRFGELLSRADQQLSEFRGTVDGIVTFWDFPSSLLHPILCRKYGIPGPPLQSVVRCDHKYWSRFMQNQVIREHVPRFHAFDPFNEDSIASIPLRYPFWVKPVASYSSFLAFRVDDEQELRRSVTEIQQRIGRYSQPFGEVFSRLDPPVGAEHVDGRWCIAEEPIKGHQCTIEGYAYEGQAKTYGVVDSFRTDNGISFHRYQYPSRLPEDVKRRIAVASRKVMEHIGYNNAGFNIEWFWDEESDALKVLEINSRISQSHSDLFEKVNGCSNHEVPVELSVGNEPSMRGRNGTYDLAAEVYLRRDEDGVVKRVPTRDEIKRVESKIPGVTINLAVREGMMLSDVLDQDPYSYRWAHVYVGGQNQKDILEKARRVEEALRFEVESLSARPEAAAAYR